MGRVVRAWAVLTALVLGLAGGASAARSQMSQHRINEMAAACVTALSGMQGVSAAKRSHESDAAYRSRIHGYFSVLSRAVKGTEPLREPRSPRDLSEANRARWHKLGADANRFPAEVSAARTSWESLQRESSARSRAELGHRLLRAQVTIQALLNSLRDARP